MIAKIVSRNIWGDCHYKAYKNANYLPSAAKKYLFETYGIEHWERVQMDLYRLRFVDEEKMIYWILKYL